ncbi:hypothetical protein GCM10029978_055830 [Actinoallomurus acanthiterrae]
MQSGMVANQARIFALRADARSRLNTAYMTCAYLGGSAGSWLGTRAYGHAGWPGVCALVAALTALALARHLLSPSNRRPPRLSPSLMYGRCRKERAGLRIVASVSALVRRQVSVRRLRPDRSYRRCTHRSET